jgi:hypothetical protein
MRRLPVWPAVGVVLFVLIWIASTIYLALALAICVGLLLAAHWAWTRLPALFEEGPDARDLAERKKREREIDAKRRSSR